MKQGTMERVKQTRNERKVLSALSNILLTVKRYLTGKIGIAIGSIIVTTIVLLSAAVVSVYRLPGVLEAHIEQRQVEEIAQNKRIVLLEEYRVEDIRQNDVILGRFNLLLDYFKIPYEEN